MARLIRGLGSKGPRGRVSRQWEKQVKVLPGVLSPRSPERSRQQEESRLSQQEEVGLLVPQVARGRGAGDTCAMQGPPGAMVPPRDYYVRGQRS